MCLRDQRHEVNLNPRAAMRKKSQLLLTVILLVPFAIGNLWSQGGRTMPFVLKATAFPEGGTIPQKYTCDGADISPELTWDGAPAGTQSLALITDDPDAPAGTWTHWIIWNIPVEKTLPEGVAKIDTLDEGTRQGRNDFKRIGYGGPCPPPGKPHRYFFRVYALDTKLDVKPGAIRSDLEHSMGGHVLAKAELVGKYGR
jgi:Raf kinase inhibitor-like YbhB/YbcL family protein